MLADTTKTNVASQKVMERAGMHRIGEDGELLYYMAWGLTSPRACHVVGA